MLVLSRKKGESIMVDHHTSITILDVEGDTIKIGIVAPKHVGIHRKEVYEAIQKANIDANAVAQLPEEMQVFLKTPKRSNN